MRAGRGGLIASALFLLAALVPGTAGAATVVNGDFESGGLSGWHVHRATEAGNWFAYKGTDAPIGSKREGAAPVQAPPQGTFAAIADEANPDTLILYQDIALEPGFGQQLALTAFYDSYKPLAIPTPDTLSVDDEELAGQSNQQFRIDVMKPEAPLESLASEDILATVFETKVGGPKRMTPTRFTADLSPFAGQTVRLRIATAAHEEVLNAGVDAVSLSGGPPGQATSGGKLRLGKARANRRNGTAVLPVQIPGPGVLAVRSGKAIKPVRLKIAKASTVKVRLRPTATALATLKRRHSLRVAVKVAYKPEGGARQSASTRVLLKVEKPGIP